MKIFKKLFIFFLLISISYILIFIGINFIFQETLEKKIEERLSRFSGAQVNIGGFKTDLLTNLSFKDIYIKREDKDFYLDSSQVDFRYYPLSLFKNRLRGVIEFKGLSVSYEDLKLKENVLINFSFKPEIFNKLLEIEEFSLYLGKTPTLKTQGRLQPIFKPQRLFLQTQILSLSWPSFSLKDLNLNFDLSEEKFFGEFLIGVLNYKKLRLNNTSSKINFQDKKLQLKDLRVDIFEGRLSGELNFSFLPPTGYDFNLKIADLSLKEITQKFAPRDFWAKGKISGELKGRIEEREFKDLEGWFQSQRPGLIKMKAIRKLLSQAKVSIDREILQENVFFYENLMGEISLLKNEIMIKLILKGKTAEFRFDIKVEPEILPTFLFWR